MLEQYIINPAITISPRFDSTAVKDGECFSLSCKGEGVACNSSFLKIILGFNEPITIRDAVEALVAANTNLSRPDIEAGIKDCFAHDILVKHDKVIEALAWHLNGWGDSYAYHQASRDQNFLDQTAGTAWEVKERVVQNYLSTASPPAAELDLSALPLSKLPEPHRFPGNFHDALMARRTVRKFLPQSVWFQDISSIFHVATAPMKTTRTEVSELSKEHPSIYLHSWLTFAEIGLYAHNCEGLEQGIYFYDLFQHGVRQLKAGNYSDLIHKASWKQGVEGASLVIFIMADLNRYMWKYRNPRHYKAVLVQSAALAHRFILAAQGAGYCSFQSPAMHDETVISLFGTSVDKLMPLYMIGIGQAAKGKLS